LLIEQMGHLHATLQQAAKNSTFLILRHGAAERMRHCDVRNNEVREIQVSARVSVPDPSVHRQLALAGAGVAMLGQAEVVTDLKERRLVRLLKEWEPEPIELFALYPSRLSAAPKVRALLEFLRERCNETYRLEGRIPDRDVGAA
jgi:DNA-binding transcriptional LysR family regulator